jgi:hypothetical protein
MPVKACMAWRAVSAMARRTHRCGRHGLRLVGAGRRRAMVGVLQEDAGKAHV